MIHLCCFGSEWFSPILKVIFYHSMALTYLSREAQKLWQYSFGSLAIFIQWIFILLGLVSSFFIKRSFNAINQNSNCIAQRIGSFTLLPFFISYNRNALILYSSLSHTTHETYSSSCNILTQS